MSLNCITINEVVFSRHLPVRRQNGTFCQRQLSIYSLRATNVSVIERGLIFFSFLYATCFFLFILASAYCPRTTFFTTSVLLNGRTDFNTSTFLLRISSASMETGGSMAVIHNN